MSKQSRKGGAAVQKVQENRGKRVVPEKKSFANVADSKDVSRVLEPDIVASVPKNAPPSQPSQLSTSPPSTSLKRSSTWSATSSSDSSRLAKYQRSANTAFRTIVGFVCSVTQILVSRDKKYKFFNFFFEPEEGQQVRGVCFDLGKHSTFQAYRDNGKAVVLENVKMGTAGFNQTISDGCIKVQRNTVVRDATDPLPFQKTIGLRKVSTLQAIKNGELNVQDDAHVAVKMVAFLGESREVDAYNTKKRCRDVLVADGTTGMRLILWESFIDFLQVGAFYSLTDLKVKFNGGSFELTTSPSSDYKAIEPLSHVVDCDKEEYAVEHGQRKIIGEVLGATVNAYHTCAICKKGLDIVNDSPVVTCASCGMRQKAAKCELNATATIAFEEQKENGETSTIDVSAAKDIIQALVGGTPLTLDTSTIADQLLFLPKMEITLDVYASKIKAYRFLDE